jgi:DNA-binding PadR family transcriptional regulator
MPLHHAVLALLGDGPNYGYVLKGAFERSVGPQWGALNIGHLYQVLDRLERDGLVIATKVAGEAKPDRVMYEMTDAGWEELADWLNSPSARTSGHRDDFFLKLMAAVHSRDTATVRTVIANQRAQLLRELRNLGQLRRDHEEDLVVRLLLRAAERHVTADLAFLDDAEENMRTDTSWTTAAASQQSSTMDSRQDVRKGRSA